MIHFTSTWIVFTAITILISIIFMHLLFDFYSIIVNHLLQYCNSFSFLNLDQIYQKNLRWLNNESMNSGRLFVLWWANWFHMLGIGQQLCLMVFIAIGLFDWWPVITAVAFEDELVLVQKAKRKLSQELESAGSEEHLDYSTWNLKLDLVKIMLEQLKLSSYYSNCLSFQMTLPYSTMISTMPTRKHAHFVFFTNFDKINWNSNQVEANSIRQSSFDWFCCVRLYSATTRFHSNLQWYWHHWYWTIDYDHIILSSAFSMVMQIDLDCSGFVCFIECFDQIEIIELGLVHHSFYCFLYDVLMNVH
jgi:hypothetical protein